MLRYRLTTAAPVRPKRLVFGLLSAEDIEKISVCAVTETALYVRGIPASGGLLDPLMGSVDRRHLCATCMRDMKLCQGHSGHIALGFPVYHVGFVDVVLKLLRCLCFSCSRLVATEEDRRIGEALQGKGRLLHFHQALRQRRACPHCGMWKPQYARDALGIVLKWPDDTPWESDEERSFCHAPFTARDALSILRNMRPDEVELLGFNAQRSHPERMILRTLLVPPPCTRPAIYSSEGSRSRGQNDLTVRYLEILRRNNEVVSSLDNSQHTWESVDVGPDLFDCIQRLQYEVSCLFHNCTRIRRPPGMGRCNSATVLKSISDRIKGKEGRIRGNLMGKRVDFSARCVITPDAYFDCDRVGVPYHVATALTIPETVNAANIHALTRRVRHGAGHLQGAENVLGSDGVMTSLRACKDTANVLLRIGDVVERYLADDDVVVFNRQPSLHMHGMQAHRVRLMPGHTFRLSLVAAAPYNADFDGDEMNMHVPQSKSAATECAVLMGVSQNCIASQGNRPVMGIVQDALLGLYALSDVDVVFDHGHLCRILLTARHAVDSALPTPAFCLRRAGVPVRRRWTGKQVFSCLLPPDFHFQPAASAWGDDPVAAWTDESMPPTILRGQLLCGVLKKSQMGSSSGGIIDVMCRDFDNVTTMNFMADVQRATNAFLLQRGHHVGIEDVMLSREGHARVEDRLHKAKRLAEEIQREKRSTPDLAEDAERAILRLLSKMLLQTGGIVNESLSRDNAIRRMVSAGSKGSFINLSQICACLGQQSLEGRRIASDKENRSLPFFKLSDTTLASHGMIFNSFALGLSPTELFFHAIGGREGLVDTAVKTSQTGYLQRRMNKSMEDHAVSANGAIRNAQHDIIAFLWGSDGMHPARLERVSMPLLTESRASIVRRFDPDEVPHILRLRRTLSGIRSHLLASGADNRFLLPFNPERVKQLLRREGQHDAATGALDVDALVARLSPLPVAVELALRDTFRRSLLRNVPDRAVRAAVSHVASAVALATLIEGECAGCIAAQSIGEPATQMTLNTFHHAGCATKNVTLGIPRLKELLDASKACKTPCTTVRYRPPFRHSEAFVRYMSTTTPLVRLSDIVSNVAVMWEPDVRTSALDADRWLVETHCALEAVGSRPDRGGEPPSPSPRSSHVIRLELNQKVMQSKGITPPMVRRILMDRLGPRAEVVSSEVNMIEWIVRVRLLQIPDMVAFAALDARSDAQINHGAASMLMQTVVIIGHPGVASAVASQQTVAVRGDDGELREETEQVSHVYGYFLSDCACAPSVDWARCSSNDIWETYNTLGIEACVHVLYDQILQVVSFDGSYVDPRHMLLIVDTMCRNGSIMPLTRHGINRSDNSPLMRASFEETVDVLFSAALFAEDENAQGITTSIMSGQMSSMGTGSVRVLMERGVADGGATNVLAQKGRTMRSVCRSFTLDPPKDIVEYIVDTVCPTGTRPLSPDTGRKRPRFRPASPTGASS